MHNIPGGSEDGGRKEETGAKRQGSKASETGTGGRTAIRSGQASRERSWRTAEGRHQDRDGQTLQGAQAHKASDNEKPGEWQQEWQRVRRQLQARLGSEVFDSWFGRLKVEAVEGGVALHSVPTAFLRNWINSHYRDILLELWKQEESSVLRADIVVRSAVRRALPASTDAGKCDSAHLPGPQSSSSAAQAGNGRSPHASSGFHAGGTAGNPDRFSGMGGSPASQAVPARAARRIGEADTGFGGSPLDRRHTFANFIDGSSNRMAHAAARSVAESDGSSVRFNPLFIHANVGLGKTHLLQAVAWEARSRFPGKKVRYLTADYFMRCFAAALRDQTALSLKESLRDIDLLLIDDMQFLQGKSIQAEFCHLLNELVDGAKQVMVAADRQPAELESLNDRVRSRLQGGVAIEIDAPEYELRKSILNMRYDEARREQPGLEIPEDIRHYVARQVNTSCRDIDGAFNQLLLQHKYSNGPDGLEELDKMLRHLVRSAETRRVRIEDIQKVVARQFNVTRNDLLSNRRTRQIVRPRQIAMYLAKTMTPRSLPEIGRRFGGRDHTTVLHAVRKIERLLAEDNKLAQEVELLKRLILD